MATLIIYMGDKVKEKRLRIKDIPATIKAYQSIVEDVSFVIDFSK